MKNKIIILFIIIAIPAITFSQEILTGLSTNPVIKNYSKKNSVVKHKRNTMLNLPFFDDFSGTDVFPNDTLWSDKNVFINSAYPYLPPTIGVATFDALNDTGALYPSASSTPFTADTLTSYPIRLDSVLGTSPISLKISDSIYFSFLYQPQGIGNDPEVDDSLVLEFYSPKTDQWRHVWASAGSNLQQFYAKYHVWFKQVMIPIKDSINYFLPGFRFRFYNYASVTNSSQPSFAAGNVDIWNLDYVYINKVLNSNDSIYKDIAFVNPAPSVLKNYTSMPWSQYKVDTTAEMKDTIRMVIRNLYSGDIQIKFKYNVFDEFGNLLAPGTDPNSHPTFPSIHPGSNNILALSVNEFTYGPPTYIEPSSLPVDFKFKPTSADSATFTIVHRVIDVSGNLHNENDSIIYVQKFYDYYAYDDGVPEAGYGLTPAGSMLAYQFKLNKSDTLRAVEMFFNQTLNNASRQYFDLTVWNDIGGYPGDTLYRLKHVRPEYQDSLNTYSRYDINDRIVKVSGTFYVGWKQSTADNLNLGFDLNNDEHTKIFYYTGSGGWSNSSFPGALMIRPLVGKAIPHYAGINETVNVTNDIKVFPNPSSGENISIDVPALKGQDVSTFSIHLFDLIGNEVYDAAFTDKINVSELQNGIYLLCIYSKDNSHRYFTKLTIVK
jgi:hypothetical protein